MKFGGYMKRIEWTEELLRNLPITRADATTEGSKYYFPIEKCSKGHFSPFITAKGVCFLCKREATAVSASRRRIRLGMKPFSELERVVSGIRYGLVVTTGNEKFEEQENGKRRIRKVEVVCDCGKIFWTRRHSLEGICACKTCASRQAKKITHGMSYDIAYQIFHSAKKRAKSENLDFSITLGDVVIPEYCPVFNTKLEIEKRKSSGIRTPRPNAPSLDRIDSTKGYTKDNICVISLRANWIKSDGTSSEHMLIANHMEAQEHGK